VSETSEKVIELPDREKNLSGLFRNKLGNNLLELNASKKRIKIKVNHEVILDAAKFIRDDLGFDHVVSVSGVDYPSDEEMEIVYHISAYERQDLRDIVIALSSRISRENPKTHSLIELYPNVEYAERETYEMLGIIFDGHPNLNRFILPEDWDNIPPLRKDFKNPGR
jgi:NADH:ubiquinone oxidoreductase subunit C